MHKPKITLALMIASALTSVGAFAGKPPFKIKRASEARINRLELTKKAVQRIGVKLGQVSFKTVPRSLKLGGRISVRPGAAALISAPFAGMVQSPRKSVLPLPGARIRAGQTLLKLRPLVAPGRHLLVEAQRDLAQARARAQTAQKMANRAKKILEDGAGDQSSVDRADESLQIAQAELAAAKERLTQLQRNPLGADVSLPVRSLDEGVVLRLLVAPGQAVAAGERLIEIANMNDLWIRVPVYVGRLDSLDRSRPLTVRPLGQSNSSGYLAQPVDAPPGALGNGSVVEVFYALSDPKNIGLSPGAQVMVQIPLKGSAKPRLVAPRSAVFYDAHGAAWVYAAAGENAFERRRVDVEAVVGELAILKHGPPRGTSVVRQGAMELFGAEFGAGK